MHAHVKQLFSNLQFTRDTQSHSQGTVHHQCILSRVALSQQVIPPKFLTNDTKFLNSLEEFSRETLSTPDQNPQKNLSSFVNYAQTTAKHLKKVKRSEEHTSELQSPA